MTDKEILSEYKEKREALEKEYDKEKAEFDALPLWRRLIKANPRNSFRLMIYFDDCDRLYMEYAAKIIRLDAHKKW